MEVRLFQLHNLRTISRLAKGLDPGPEGSALKLYWSEMSKRLHDTAMAVVGDAAPLWQGAEDNPGDGNWQRSWLYYQASSIFAGTNEIQRTIWPSGCSASPGPAPAKPADAARPIPPKGGRARWLSRSCSTPPGVTWPPSP